MNQIFTMRKWLFHHFQLLKTGFQVYLPTPGCWLVANEGLFFRDPSDSILVLTERGWGGESKIQWKKSGINSPVEVGSLCLLLFRVWDTSQMVFSFRISEPPTVISMLFIGIGLLEVPKG